MKDSELIRKNYNEILSVMELADAETYMNTNCEYRVYIDSEGCVGYEVWAAGDNGYYRFCGDYYRVYIATMCHQFFDILDDYWYVGNYVNGEWYGKEKYTDEENDTAMQEAIEEATTSYEAVESYRFLIEERIAQCEEEE